MPLSRAEAEDSHFPPRPNQTLSGGGTSTPWHATANAGHPAKSSPPLREGASFSGNGLRSAGVGGRDEPQPRARRPLPSGAVMDSRTSMILRRPLQVMKLTSTSMRSALRKLSSKFCIQRRIDPACGKSQGASGGRRKVGGAPLGWIARNCTQGTQTSCFLGTLLAQTHQQFIDQYQLASPASSSGSAAASSISGNKRETFNTNRRRCSARPSFFPTAPAASGSSLRRVPAHC